MCGAKSRRLPTARLSALLKQGMLFRFLPNKRKTRRCYLLPEESERFEWLNQKKSDVTSQFGEDGIVDAVFERIGTTNKWCLEVGAADGRWFSNTYRLLHQGWFGVLIEANPVQFAKLATRWPGHICRNLAIVPEGEHCLDNILAKLDAPKELDLISIDIDGDDYWVWKFLRDYSARVVIVEHAYHAVGDKRKLVPAMGNTNQAGDIAIGELAASKGYTVVAKTDCNSICVKNELADKVKGNCV